LKTLARIIVNDSVICAELDGESVLLHVETGVYFGLNQVGSDIWRYLTEGLAESEMLANLEAEYDADPNQLRVDLEKFLAALDEKGLISRTSE
jgi:hypothetical protein